MLAVAALTNKTWADDRVYDSDNRPLAEVLQAETQPYIVVYTDEDTRSDIHGKDIHAGTRSLSLVLEIGVASAVTASDGTKTIEVPATDEGMEFAVDCVESQALTALLTDPYNEWAEILREIIVQVTRVPSRRGGSAERGVRWAARQVILMVDTISDPPPGVQLDEDHAVMRFINLAKTSPPGPMTASAELIEKILCMSPAPDWRQVQAWLVLTKQGIRSMGLAPLLETDEEAGILEEVSPVQEEWPDETSPPEDDPFD